MKRVLLGVVQPAAADAAKVGKTLVDIIQTPAIGSGFNLAEIRARLKVVDKIEAAMHAEWVDLEDAEHALVQRALEGANFFTKAERAIVEIADRVIGAKAPPKPE